MNLNVTSADMFTLTHALVEGRPTDGNLKRFYCRKVGQHHGIPLLKPCDGEEQADHLVIVFHGRREEGRKPLAHEVVFVENGWDGVESNKSRSYKPIAILQHGSYCQCNYPS